MPLPKNYPKLEGWLTVTETALQLKVSRQACHKMITEGVFKSVHTVGNGMKPIYVVTSDEVAHVKASRSVR
jgi:hypothetical protein